MIPALDPSRRTDNLYLQFLQDLEDQGFKGDLKQDYGKTRKPLVAGKLHKVASILRQASGVLLQVEVLIC